MPIENLQQFMPSLQSVSQFGRQIRICDLISALRYLESSTPRFHISRMKILVLERDQAKPVQEYSLDDGFFVLTRL